jgi:DNA-directed RNA polymerase I subunit RPA49
LYYISVMFAFRWASKGAIEKTQLQEKLGGVPSIIVDGLLARFTETSRGSAKYVYRIPMVANPHHE